MKLSAYIKLTDGELALVANADRCEKPTSKRTRKYVLTRNRSRSDDIMFILVGVRHFRGERRIKPLAVTSVDGKTTTFSGDCAIMCSACLTGDRLKVGWRECDLTKDGEMKKHAEHGSMWWYDGKERAWALCDRKGGRDETRYWLWCYRPLNWSETVAANPRFRYNSWRGTFSPLDWLRRYSVAPEVENFAKMGIARLASVSFVEKLRADKGLFRFVRENLDAIKERWTMKPSDLFHAYRHGLTIDEELVCKDRRAKISRFKRELGRDTCARLPRAFDYAAARNYLDRADGVSIYEYRRYLDYCLRGGADLTAPQTARPRDIEARLRGFDEADERAKRREERKTRRERKAALAGLARRYAAMCARMKTGGYALVFPASPADFVREGRAMGNCIGGGNYAMRHADGLCVCVFIRRADRPDEPYVDVEIDEYGAVRQCYAKNNREADEDCHRLAVKVARAIFRKSRKAA